MAAYAFRVLVGTSEFGFSKISGLGRRAEGFTYQEGGLNDRVHVLPGPVKRCGTVRLERGAYAGEYFPFYLAGERLAEPMRIEARAAGEQALGKVYTLTGLVVKAWEAGELDALQNSILIDRFELDYEALHLSLR